MFFVHAICDFDAMESKHIRIVQKKVNRLKRLFFVLLLLLCYTARAEYSDHRNRKVDSLENVLQSGQRMSDEQLIRLHSDLMWGYLQTDGLRAETNARKVLALSYEHDWLNSRADALRLLGLLAYGRASMVRLVISTTYRIRICSPLNTTRRRCPFSRSMVGERA